MTRITLITIQPGPTVCIWKDGKLLEAVPLPIEAAQGLAIDLQVEAMRAARLAPVDFDDRH